jgi:hypothetical protein
VFGGQVRVRVGRLGQPPVGQLDDPAGADEQIAGLDVAVGHPAGGGVGERLGAAAGQRHRDRRRERAAESPEQGLHARPGHELGGEVVEPALAADAVQAGEEGRFAGEPGRRGRAEAPPGQQLERDDAVAAELPGAVHRPLRAAAHLRQQAEVTQGERLGAALGRRGQSRGRRQFGHTASGTVGRGGQRPKR